MVGTANVTVINQAPTFTTASITTNQATLSTAVTIAVTDLDTVHGDAHSFSIVTQPAHGVAMLSGDQLTYRPDDSYNGSDTFTIRATDAGGLSVNGTTDVVVTAVKLAPVATRAGFAVNSANLTNSGGLPYVDDRGQFAAYNLATTTTLVPVNGSATISGNLFSYTASLNTFSGVDKFSYSVTDSSNSTLTLNGTALVKIYNATDFLSCTTPSSVIAGSLTTRITAGPCAFYGEVITRHLANGITPVTVKYIALRPSTGVEPKGVVVQIGGGDLDMKLIGTVATGVTTSTGDDYLIRSAQLLARGGYLVIAMDRPSDRSTANPLEIDAYRVSVDHTVDILNVLKETNTTHLPVFLSGTSRGAISVVANNLIANRIELSSPVTATDSAVNQLYVGIPGQPYLQRSYIQRPTYMLWHAQDACPLSTPANSQALYDGLSVINKLTEPVPPTSGTPVTTPASDVCGAFDYHGFMGIEDIAAGFEIKSLDGAMTDIFGRDNASNTYFTKNHPPEAAYTKIYAARNNNRTINLTTFARDIDLNNTLSFALPRTTTVLGGSVSISGAVVTYVPPVGAGSAVDYLPYVVTDNNGGVAAAVIEIQLSN